MALVVLWEGERGEFNIKFVCSHSNLNGNISFVKMEPYASRKGLSRVPSNYRRQSRLYTKIYNPHGGTSHRESLSLL